MKNYDDFIYIFLHFSFCFSTPFFSDFHTSSYSFSFSFWILLQHPDHSKCSGKCMKGSRREEEEEEERRILDPTTLQPSLSLGQKLRLLPSLLKYMVPLGLVFLGEYIINQGLVSLWLLFIHWKVTAVLHENYECILLVPSHWLNWGMLILTALEWIFINTSWLISIYHESIMIFS